MTTILDDLRDLEKQATTERSHYYVRKTALRAILEIEALHTEVEALRTVLRQSRGA